MPNAALAEKAQVVVLDGRDVPNPEDLAMLLALYSRDPRSVLVHLEQVRKSGSSKFMGRFYVGYGHKSIGDCGTTALCFEWVSMLAAKAIQDTPLYSGQEASTRYLDMTSMPVMNPLGTDEGADLQKATMSLYATTLDALFPSVAERFPRKDGEDEVAWKKAVRAKSFDIARSLIPAGATTFVAWTTNLRQVADHLKELRNHPLPEMPGLASLAQAQLEEKYEASFDHKRYDAEEEYVRASMARFAYYDDAKVALGGFEWAASFDFDALRDHAHLLKTRPKKTELHQRFRRYGTATFTFPLDFGSYRDLQRQRSAVQEMPLLTTKYGFHSWYLEHLPPGTFAEIEKLRARIDALDADPLVRQYYIPMGFIIPVVMVNTLPSAVYIAELRSDQTVHPTLRMNAQKIGDALTEIVPGLAMHHDKSPDAWSIKRGTQDIVARK